MSDLIAKCQLSDSKDCPAVSTKPIHTRITTKNANIGNGVMIRRALPARERRMIGAWCFFDHFGPINLQNAGLNIGPHPHIGLQTFTWTLEGEILHRDSLGSEQVIRPGAVNLMTAGQGIAHTEESISKDVLHGVQLWIALPDSVRNQPPEFAHYAAMPTDERDGLLITLLVGELFHLRAPTKVHSPLIGLDLNALKDVSTTLPLQPGFEYGVLVLTGSVTVEDQTIAPGTLLYLGCGRDKLTLSAPQGSRIFMVGGEPFAEEILLWWNFVARTRAEIVEASRDWEAHTRFGEVVGYHGDRLDSPEVPWIK